MKKIILVTVALATALSANAIQTSATKNKNLKVFITKDAYSQTLREGVVHDQILKSDADQAALVVLARKAKAAGFPIRTKRLDIYTPIQVITIATNATHTIEIEGHPKSEAAYALVVSSKSNAKLLDVLTEVNIPALTTLTLKGQMAKDLKAALVKMGLTEGQRGVVSIFGSSNIYEVSFRSNAAVTSDAMCGDIDGSGQEKCIIYNNSVK